MTKKIMSSKHEAARLHDLRNDQSLPDHGSIFALHPVQSTREHIVSSGGEPHEYFVR